MPMPVNTSSLLNELRSTLHHINAQIEAVHDDFNASQEAGVNYQPEVTIYQLKNSDGNHVLTPLLLAKANCLNAIATLQAPVKR